MHRLNRGRTRIGLAAVIALLLSITVATPALAHECSIETIAGAWVFATQRGQMLSRTVATPVGVTEALSRHFGVVLPPGFGQHGSEGFGQHGRLTDITALGTMNFDKSGNLSGKFDVSILGAAFFSDNTYNGLVTVNPDCTGTLSFIASLGPPTNQRTDSIVISGNGSKIWGMVDFITDLTNDEQEVRVSWTYTAKRIGGKNSKNPRDCASRPGYRLTQS